ncbi:universal stress protein [Natronorarus salvus]|uniref:universal stress protein n=1 Tax=Natronorarus salvus TaxID=3117733 RepID=UPI002F269512
MGIDTILVAVAEEDQDRGDVIASTVIDVAKPTGATVVIAHVIAEETYREVVERAGAVVDGDDDDVPEWARQWARLDVGIEGEVPEWVERWAVSEVSEEPREISGPEALEVVLEQRALLRELAGAFEEAGVEYEIRIAVGDPAEEVPAMAEESDADFVVVGGRNRSPARQAVFGSVSQTIVRSVGCPVISIREGVRTTDP